ncbi:MAG: phosphoribosylaminoimidazolesuccinocarboxamide synthase [Bacilli bacterium]|jgi:phosphoribosylaminoimidazole-succinocarboxamide synthase|nr:phosphoribosylaminoimidazolesuccinocarboxamide synthase [Bacilli bacterium]
MNQANVIYEGKAKYLLKSDNEDEVIVYFKDDATAFNGVKKDNIASKGILNNKITTIIFKYLIKNGIKTHYLKTLNDREQLCQKVTIIPLEFINRNIVAGSMAKRLGVEEGTKLTRPIKEISYKCDELNDPLLNDDHAIGLGIVSEEDLMYCYEEMLKINNLLIKLFDSINLILVDFKIEFGFNKDNEILLCDEFSPDNCRLWEKDTMKKMDKDVFRRDLGNIIDTYTIILEKLEGLGEIENV